MQIKYNMCDVKKKSVKCKELVNPVVAMGITCFLIANICQSNMVSLSCLNRGDTKLCRIVVEWIGHSSTVIAGCTGNQHSVRY